MTNKIVDEEMVIRTLPTTLLEILFMIIVNSKVIFKCIMDPDVNCWKNS